ncbi:hypothetical protein D3C79_1000050 [compost metagenome]
MIAQFNGLSYAGEKLAEQGILVANQPGVKMHNHWLTLLVLTVEQGLNHREN